MKRKIIEIEAGKSVNLLDFDISMPQIKRLWTIYDEDEMWNHFQFNPHTGEKIEVGNLETLYLQHNVGVFLESYVHDYDLEDNTLEYYSRVVEKGEKIKLLLEYETKTCGKCHYWNADGGFGVPYCGLSGLSIGHGSKGMCGEEEKRIFCDQM